MGVFSTTLSREYALAMHAFQLSREVRNTTAWGRWCVIAPWCCCSRALRHLQEIKALTLRTIDCTFATELEKLALRSRFDEMLSRMDESDR